MWSGKSKLSIVCSALLRDVERTTLTHPCCRRFATLPIKGLPRQMQRHVANLVSSLFPLILAFRPFVNCAGASDGGQPAPLGKLIDVSGGRRVHIYCTGEGSLQSWLSAVDSHSIGVWYNPRSLSLRASAPTIRPDQHGATRCHRRPLRVARTEWTSFINCATRRKSPVRTY